MKYLFVVGRNPVLSKAEIISYLEREGVKLNGTASASNGLVVDVDRELKLKEMIGELGGTIAAGKVILSGEIDRLSEEIRKKPIYFGRENKVIYSVLDFTDDERFDEVLESIKENFKNERLKARYKGVSGTIKMQTGEIVHGSPEKIMLRDMNYFVFSSEKSGEMYFGSLEESYDVDEAERKDMKKPYRRESLAISPRLARILINLSQVKRGQVLLDPFCGIGVILGEAMLKGIDVIGIDIDSEAINNAKGNIDWLRANYKVEAGAQIINRDSRTAKLNEVDGIASEPSLGELMTKLPQREKAMQMISDFERLMIDVLNNVKQSMKKGSRIAFTSPLIKSQKGKVSCNIENITDKTGLRLADMSKQGISFPIQEFRRDQIVGRDIFVLAS